jgi:hypothetical protein
MGTGVTPVFTIPGFGTFGGTFFTITTPKPQPVDVHTETFGFEKTFGDGRFSFGMEMPLVQEEPELTPHSDGFGDLSLIFKYAVLRDDESGSLLSAGLMVTVPTGIDTHVTPLFSLAPVTPDIVVHSTRIQPYLGYVLNSGDVYFHGFSSIDVPTDGRDVTVWFNDIGVGYWAYRGACDGLVSSVIPTLEAHLTTPLNHRNSEDLITIPNILDFTAGVHVGVGRSSLFTVGLCTPVTGPRPFDIEAIAQFNLRF